MPSAPWMPFYGEDFFSSEVVRVTSRETRMIYLELLWFAWNSGRGSIPDNTESLAHVVQVDAGEFARHWSALAPEWVPHPEVEGRLIQPRLWKEYARKEDITAKRKRAAMTRHDAKSVQAS